MQLPDDRPIVTVCDAGKVSRTAVRRCVSFRAHGYIVAVLAVEMQAASLFASGRARGAAVATVALVSSSVDQVAAGFDMGRDTFRMKVLEAIVRAARTSTFQS